MASLTIHSPSPLPPLSKFPVRTSKKRRKKTTRSGPYPRTRSPVRTRSYPIEVQHGPIKLSKETPTDSTAGAASNKFVQKKFMEMIGWVDRGIKIDHSAEVLSKEVSSVIACANMHSYHPSVPTDGDGYYTPTEFENSLVGALKNYSRLGLYHILGHKTQFLYFVYSTY